MVCVRSDNMININERRTDKINILLVCLVRNRNCEVVFGYVFNPKTTIHPFLPVLPVF